MPTRSVSPTKWRFLPPAYGAANGVMQLAKPGVGYGVVMESKVDSGNLHKHPNTERGRTTLTYIAVAIAGSCAG